MADNTMIRHLSNKETVRYGLLMMTSLLAVYVICVWIRCRDAVSDHQAERFFVCAIVLTITQVLSAFYYKQIEKLALFAVIGYSLYEIILGVVQLAGWSESRHLLFRMTGSFMNPNLYGGFLAASSVIVLALLLSGQTKGWFKITLKIVLFAEAILIPATRCRSAYLAVVIGTLIILIQRYEWIMKIIADNKKTVVSMIVVFILFLLAWKHQSTDGRMFIYRMGLMTIMNNGFKGGGLGHYQDMVSKTQLDFFQDRIPLSYGCFEIPRDISKECLLSGTPEYALCDPVQMGVEMGLAGVLLYFGVMSLTICILFIRKSPLLYGLIAVQITSLFSYTMYVPQFQLFVAVCVGLAVSGLPNKAIPIVVLSFLIFLSFLLIRKTVLFKNTYYKEWQSDRIFYQARDYDVYSNLCFEKDGRLDYSIDFLYEYGCSLAETGYYDKSDSVLRIGADNFGNPAFYMKMGDNSLSQEQYEQAESYYWKAFCTVPNHITPLFGMAELYLKQGDTIKFNNMFQCIDSFNSKNSESRKQNMLRTLKEKALEQ